jgi:hypothetical protein
MIDKNRIFGLFGNEENGISNPISNVSKKILEEPYTKLGMFTKLIINHQVFHQKLEKFLKAESPNYSVTDTKEASEYTVYNRAYHYISKIDLEDIDHLEALVDFKTKELIDSLNQAINYFEREEEYEKCAFLLEIQTLKRKVENSVPL